MRRPLHALLATALLWGGACKSEETPARSAPPAAKATSETAAKATSETTAKATAEATAETKSETTNATPGEDEWAPQSKVNFKIDGKKLPPIALKGETGLLSIAELPPIDEWKRLIVLGDDGLEFRASNPKLLTGAITMKLVRRPDTGYDFLVTRMTAGKESIRNKRADIKVVEVQRQGYEPPAPPKPKASLTITIAGKKSEKESAAIEAIERTPEPGEEEDRDTWLVVDLLKAETQSLKEGQSIVLRSEGEELVLQSSELADRNKLHIIKRNRRGAFHYRGWTLGEAPTRSSELRNLVEVEVR